MKYVEFMKPYISGLVFSLLFVLINDITDLFLLLFVVNVICGIYLLKLFTSYEWIKIALKTGCSPSATITFSMNDKIELKLYPALKTCIIFALLIGPIIMTNWFLNLLFFSTAIIIIWIHVKNRREKELEFYLNFKKISC